MVSEHTLSGGLWKFYGKCIKWRTLRIYLKPCLASVIMVYVCHCSEKLIGCCLKPGFTIFLRL